VNQIKTRLVKIPKLEMLKVKLLTNIRPLLKLFLLLKLKLLVLTLLLTTLQITKMPPRRDAGGAARRHD
jgi:hypothetical protein